MKRSKLQTKSPGIGIKLTIPKLIEIIPIPKLIAANKTHEEIITTLVAKYNIDQEQAESYYEQVMALRA